MAQFRTYCLRFKGALHLSDVREDYGNTELQLHSDTLQAALLAALAAIGQVPADGILPFSVSSMFPFYQDAQGETHYFFPKPFLRFNVKTDIPGLAKKLKKVRWVDQSYYEKIIQGQPLTDFGVSGMEDFQGDFLHRQPIVSPLYHTQTLPRVKVPRHYQHPNAEDNNTEIFYMQVIRFRQDAGFYFMADGSDDGLALLERGLRVLEDEGFGTDRYVGNGHFEWETGNISVQTDTDGTYITNLSLFCPEHKAQLISLIDDKTSYELLKRGGWITTPGDLGKRKRFVYMMAEGSIFSNPSGSIQQKGFIELGKPNIDMKPDIPTQTPAIYRSGKSIFLPVKLVL